MAHSYLRSSLVDLIFRTKELSQIRYIAEEVGKTIRDALGSWSRTAQLCVLGIVFGGLVLSGIWLIYR